MNVYYIPTQEQFQIVIDNLEKVIEKYPEAEVSMMIPSINYRGSPMCPAGWYAFIHNITHNDYTAGAALIAEHLGFSSSHHLKMWAYDNPKIWGNKSGAGMFCDGAAFGGDDTTITNLSQIINHWKEVKVRANHVS